MRGLFLSALAIGIWVIPNPQTFGQPEQGVIETNRAASAKETQKAKQDQQSAETVAIQGILAQITQIQQQHAQELKDAETQKNQDANISEKIKTYTFWLIIVGGIQAVVLALTVWAVIRQTTSMQNSERAWVLVNIGKLPDLPVDPTTVAFLWIKPSIENSGKTPARINKIVARKHEMQTTDTGLPGPLPQEAEYPLDQTTIIEGKDIVLPPNLPIQPINVPITPEVFLAASQGRIFVYIYGYVEYLDTIRKQRHTSKFCFIYLPKRGFSPDPSGFYVAGNTPPKYIGAT